MGNGAYSKRLRVAGNVQPGSIKRTGTHVQFVLMEQDQLLSVDYTGTEAPPDTFKDDSQALADGSFGPRRCFSRQGAAGEMRVEVCAAATRRAREWNAVFRRRKSVTQPPFSITLKVIDLPTTGAQTPARRIFPLGSSFSNLVLRRIPP